MQHMLFSTYNIFLNPKLRDDNTKGHREPKSVPFVAIGVILQQAQANDVLLLMN